MNFLISLHFKHFLKTSLVLFFAISFSSFSYAIQSEEPEFFLISDKSLFQQNQISEFTTPQSLISESWTQGLAKKYLSLLKWIFYKNPNPSSYEDYTRQKHFGTWINDPNDDTCYNTRAKVLIRDSYSAVTYKGPRNCTVDKGLWFDPYTKRTYISSADIQIDHVIPLKEAYDSGAWKWNFYTRCLFSNYMGNSIHLMSVYGSANMSKGDKSPDKWLPPNESYRCEYVRNWLIIKLIWNLALSPQESLGIQNVLAKYRCNPNQYAISQQDFQNQRNLIIANAKLCDHLKPR